MKMKKIWIITIGISLSVFLMMPTNTSVINYGGNEEVSGIAGENDSISPAEFQGNLPDNETEYWALIVAVGVYANNPDMDRPSMLVEADELHKMLPVSSNWDESHIKVIEGENATVPNIIKGFR
ncbi:MAG: hypothetical protein J7L93_00760, partial [Thermoplasmata archaeon]|nr:hypothetical protein [Thermoplasmata archaeon]